MNRAATCRAIRAALGVTLLAFALPVWAEEKFVIEPLRARPEQFPVATQFSPVPAGEGWTGQKGPLDREILRRTVDSIIAHGFSGLEWRTGRPADEERFILDYAQSRGMFITHHVGALELFGRNAPPSPSVYSPEYAKKVRANAERALHGLEAIPRLYNVFTFQDEPFHWGPKSFGRDAATLAAFRDRYGYALPADLDSIRDDARKWLDVINFRSDNFAVGWRQVYPIIKEINPGFKTVLTHDSHNTFGAGYSSHSELAIDDVFHWGGDFSDMYVFDIYPYMSLDFRFGEVARLNKPRISQTHYAFAQMRNLTRTYKRELGFWFGTFNHSSGWFTGFLDESLRAKHWAEREMSVTAAAQGADFLLTGYKIPDDAKHWESLGTGLRLLQKAGDRLLDAPKVKARACMLFPRTHYIQLQEEYFNVGLSFELFLRAFGELDILHEEQVTDERLDGYQALLLFDIKLLPKEVADHIVRFVHNGGLLIADCVPYLDADRKPMSVMEDLFGVRKVATGRIRRMGHWVNYREKPHKPQWANRPGDAPDESVFTTDRLVGSGFGRTFDLSLVSPRSATLTTGRALLKTASGAPGLVHRKASRGDAWLIGFCVQDTYFQAWKNEDTTARGQLRDLLRGITHQAGLRSHVRSSNPDIEASVRANAKEGFLFVINHESMLADTTITVADLDFEVARVIDMANDKPQTFERGQKEITIQAGAGLGETRLFHLKPLAKDAKVGTGGRDSAHKTGDDSNTKPAHFSLWQLSPQTPTQMVAYVLVTGNGKVIVIDGGNRGDAPQLRKFLEPLGNRVHAWFLSHPHEDHVDALTAILEDPVPLIIEAIYGSLPEDDWVAKYEPEPPASLEHLRAFRRAVCQADLQLTELSLGQDIRIDGIRIEILGIKNPEITANAINNSSLVLRISDAKKAVLFTGDLGVEGGRKLLAGPYRNRLRADYVQMAHHGQNGVDKDFYKAVSLSVCLWPTPRWLWENDSGKGPGSGPWVTLTVRKWMKELGVCTHHVAAFGLQQIE